MKFTLMLALEVMVFVLAATVVILYAKLRAALAEIKQISLLLEELKSNRVKTQETLPVLKEIVVQLRTAAETVISTTEMLNRMEAAAELVAQDLAEAHARADESIGPDGAAADAASRSGMNGDED